MKKLLFLLTLIGLGIHTQAQTFEWAKSMGGINLDVGYSIAVDGAGNVYTTGEFWTTADFDPGIGIYNLTAGGWAPDIFISKLDASGNFVWAKRIGATAFDIGYSIAVDMAGNVYTTGYFSGTVDFDPGAGTVNLTSAGSGDIFVVKLDASGNFVWAKRIGASGLDSGRSIVLDVAGNIYTTGYFSGTVDFDPGVGTVNLTSVGTKNIFVSKLDTSGNFVWAESMGGTSDARGYSIAVDAAGNVYTTGSFLGTGDFDPGAGTVNLTSTGSYIDIFVSKLDVSGNFVWAKKMGGGSWDVGNSIAVDTSGNVYTTGYFNATADFDPGAGIINLTSAGNQDIFVSKLDASGNFVWAKKMGGGAYNDYGCSIAVDASENVYTTGSFGGTVDFDPGAGIFTLYSGYQDVFVSKLDASGNFVWAKGMGGDIGYSIAVDAAGNIYTTGSFQQTGDFDPGAGIVNLTSAGQEDIFVSKLGCSGVMSTDTVTACDSVIWLDGLTYTSSTNTSSFTIVNGAVNGCDSIVTLNLTINSNTGTDTKTACDSLTWLDGITYSASTSTPTFTLTNAAGCDSVVTLNLTINANSSTDVVTACDSITWLDGITYSASTSTPTFTLTNVAGCDSVVTLNLTINANLSTDVVTACDSITWIDGNTYVSNTNTPTFTLTNAAGCDSVVTLNLTINTPNLGTDVQTACDSLTWIDGNTYSATTNTPTFTLTNTAGCDSVVTLNLTINNNDTSITQNMNTLTAGATGATYQWIDCNNGNAVIIGETNQSYIPASSGNYAVVVSKNGCTDTSACINFIITGISDLENSYVKISPNPTTAEFIIELASFSPKTQLSIVSVEGKTVYTNNTINTDKIVINSADWSKGIYMVKITDEQNNQVVKLIKQ